MPYLFNLNRINLKKLPTHDLLHLKDSIMVGRVFQEQVEKELRKRGK